MHTNDIKEQCFLAWFEANRIYPEGKNLTYSEYPSHFVWIAEQREWKPRKRGVTVGRLTYIPLGSRELYYLRLLLNFKKGCCDYDNIRTVNSVIYKTYKEACYAMGLLAVDKEFTDAIIEASNLASGIQLRRLFVTLLLMNTMSRPEEFRNKTWKLLLDDIVYQKRKEFNLPGINLCFLKVYNILFSSTNDIFFFARSYN